MRQYVGGLVEICLNIKHCVMDPLLFFSKPSQTQTTTVQKKYELLGLNLSSRYTRICDERLIIN